MEYFAELIFALGGFLKKFAELIFALGTFRQDFRISFLDTKYEEKRSTEITVGIAQILCGGIKVLLYSCTRHALDGSF